MCSVHSACVVLSKILESQRAGRIGQSHHNEEYEARIEMHDQIEQAERSWPYVL